MTETETTIIPFVWEDEDGERYYAAGHWTLAAMIEAAEEFVRDVGCVELEKNAIDPESLNLYYVVPDPKDDERYLIVPADHPKAEPMTCVAVR